MFKAAQSVPEDVIVTLPMHQEESDNEIVLYKDLPTTDEVVEMHAPENHEHSGEIELSFKLPFFPGHEDPTATSGDELEVTLDGDKETDKKEDDKSKAADQPKDLNWVKNYLNKIPKHKGETVGLERAKSYLNRGSNMLSKMVQDDHEGKIDISKAEDARIEIENGMERLEKELTRRKKKADKDDSMTKKSSTRVGGVLVTVPLIVSAIARACINATVSGGKDLEHTFDKLATKFKLSDREKVEVIQLLADMNFPFRRDLFLVDDKNPYGYSSEDNSTFPPNYYS